MSRPGWGQTFSLRAKLLIIVLGGAIVPLALVGAWLADGVQRSGEAMLSARLDSSLTRAAMDVGAAWVRQRSALLTIAEDSSVRSALASGAAPERITLSLRRQSFRELYEATDVVLVHDARHPIWVLGADASGVPTLFPAADSMRVAPGRSTSLEISIPIHDAIGARQVGRLESRLKVGALTTSLSSGAALAGAVFAVVDRTSGKAVVPLPFELGLMRQREFAWAGEQWLSTSRMVEEPTVELLAAAPITPYTAPFKAARTRGLLALALVGAGALLVTLVLTGNVTYSLVQLATAADSVTRGDLTPHLEVEGRDEVGRVAHAFNGMVASLKRMLRERSEREAVAAVGEFAASLAHEIRNPLSTVRLNLQHLEEQLPTDTPARPAVARALSDIDRLNRTVAGVLRMARSGSLVLTHLDLRDVLRAAAAAAHAELERSGVELGAIAGDQPLMVAGNAAALEQLFLNLLLNAIQASAPGSRIGFDCTVEDEMVAVTVWDEGRGFAEGGADLAFEAFYSTRPEGTGLGLTVARRIAVAHSGTITIASEPGHGARIRVLLPQSRGDNPSGALASVPTPRRDRGRVGDAGDGSTSSTSAL